MKQMKSQKVGKYHVGQRWTPELAKTGFTPVTAAFLRHYHQLNMRPAEAMLVIHLLSFKWSVDAPYPSLEKIAKQMGVTVRYVRRLCATLESVNLIKRDQRRGMTSLYDFSGLFSALEERVRAASPAPSLAA